MPDCLAHFCEILGWEILKYQQNIFTRGMTLVQVLGNKDHILLHEKYNLPWQVGQVIKVLLFMWKTARWTGIKISKLDLGSRNLKSRQETAHRKLYVIYKVLWKLLQNFLPEHLIRRWTSLGPSVVSVGETNSPIQT